MRPEGRDGDEFLDALADALSAAAQSLRQRPRSWATEVDRVSDPPLPEGKLLLTVADVAQRLSIGRTKAYELIRLGEIPSVTLGRRRLVPIDGLREFISTASSE